MPLKKYIVTCLMIFSCLTLAASAQDEKLPKSSSQNLSDIAIPQELKNKCNKFFESLIKIDVKTAFDNLLAKSPLNKKEEQVTNLMTQTKSSIKLYGNIDNYEMMSGEAAGTSLIRLRYLALHNEYPMRWIFTFYKSPKHGWIVINIKFDDLAEYFFTDQ